MGYVVSLETAIPYVRAWRWQQQLVTRYKRAGCSMRDTLILLQHPPVYTLGQGADIRFLKFAPGSKHYELHRVERGGEVTYHCPGQVVGYPILDLKQHRMDLHWYLRELEEVIILVLAEYGLRGDRLEGMTGVWVDGYKVAAIGIKVSRWITMHGFALNVCPDMGGFERIVPCGLEGKSVGSIAQFVPDISLKQVQQTLIEQFEQVFGLTFEPTSISDLNL
ncbi:lipoyltransferase [Synechococcus sp. PCC 7335]|nr:lipoyltransferase [Synechococcus sp. PCC 7335]